MKTRMNFFRKTIAALLSTVVIVCMLPAIVMAAGKNYTSATNVTFGVNYTGEITDSNRVEWYKVVLPSAGRITVRAEANICRVYYNFFQGEYAETQLLNKDVSWNSQTYWSSYTYQERYAAGTYYFRVTKDSNYDYYGEFNVTFSFESSGESFVEQIGGTNNNFSTASNISLNKEYYGQICSNDTADYFKFYLPVDTTVEIPAKAYLTRVYFLVFNAEYQELYKNEVWSDGAVGYIHPNIKLNLKKGTYYFALNRTSTCDGVYSFKISANIAGWQKDSKGWWYRNNDGSYAASTWKQIDGKWYYFDLSGYITIGWKNLGGKWYYFDNNGVMQSGWNKLSGKWYYFDGNGAMQTGWICYGGKWYHTDSNGALQTGWQQLQNKWYYFDGNGAMQTGWISYGGKWYHTDSNGVMQTGWVQLQGKWYYFKSSGVMAANEWIGHYYLQADGSMK